jgi:hypothetical protein
MAGTPVDIVRRVLSDPTNPAVVNSFATARSFRSGGTWTINSDPDGHTIEV